MWYSTITSEFTSYVGKREASKALDNEGRRNVLPAQRKVVEGKFFKIAAAAIYYKAVFFFCKLIIQPFTGRFGRSSSTLMKMGLSGPYLHPP